MELIKLTDRNGPGNGAFSLNKTMKKDFKKQYRDLEMRVIRELRDLVEDSSYKSKTLDEKAIEVNVFDYKELAVVNDRLTFIDSRGLQYSLFADVTLEDLIDILNSKTVTT